MSANTSEPEEVLVDMMDMIKGISVKDRRYRFRSYKQCFVASEAADWVAKYIGGAVTEESKGRALKMLKSYQTDGYIQHVVDHDKDFADGYFFFEFTDKAKDCFTNRRRALSSGNLSSLAEVLAAVSDSVTGVPVKDRKWRLKTYKNCFVASELLDWMMKNLRMRTRDDAVELANRFVANGSIRHVVEVQPIKDDYLFFRFTEKSVDTAAGAEPAKLEDFAALKVLGIGGFGKVILARKRDNGRTYALKVLKKAAMRSEREFRNFKSELAILKNDHPFLVHLYWTFQTGEDIYLVLDYLPGGDMFFHLQQYKQGFPVDVVRFFIAEIILALEYLHACGVVYRDLKLENILLDKEGHVCLTDFGLSKSLGEADRTETMCGTPGYLAPEILSRKPYSTAVDYWSLGVLMFELSSGLNPFLSDTTQKTLQNVINKTVIYPDDMFSKEAKSFLQLLLVRDPSKRLTNPDEMKKHPFFKGIDWNRLLLKKIKSPFRINVNSDTDTANFDSAFTRQNVSDHLESSSTSDLSASDPATDHFKDFDYVAPDANLL